VTNAQQRWKKWLDEGSITILENFAADVKLAWKTDSAHPGSYPEQTAEVFYDTISELRGKKIVQKKRRRLPPPPSPAKRFAELFDEWTLRAVYEDNHVDSYDAALKAADAGRDAGKAFHKLMKAAETAYDIRMGAGTPAPRNSFLHRKLLDLAKVLDLDKHRNTALAEFFDDLCPCGKTHKAEAIRKLRKRKEAKSGGQRSRSQTKRPKL
jgi:hypothetical protein